MSPERRALLFLLVACLFLFVFQLGNHDLWDPDEPRYGGITRAMLRSGDWIRLTDNGENYIQKPPLFFWILAATATLSGGLNETTARIPSSIAALLCVLCVYRFGRRLFGFRVGWLAAWGLATTQRFFVEARWVHMDTLLTLFILLSMESAHRALEGEKREWVWMYLWMALGCLTKGPLAMAIPVAALLVYLGSCREMVRLKECGGWWGLPLAVAPTAAWLFVNAHLSGFDPAEVLREQILQRFQEGLHHPRPFFYYFYSLPVEFLPWTLFLPGTVRFTFPSSGGKDRRSLLFFYGWVIGGFALLSLVAEKRPSYLLSIFPALALLVGVFLDSFLTRYDAAPLKRWMEWPLALAGAVCLAATGLLARWGRYHPGFAHRLVPLGLFLVLVFSGTLWALRKRHRGAGIIILLTGIFAGYLWVVAAMLPWLNPYKSARPFCERVLSRIGLSPLGIYEDNHPGVAYYCHRSLKLLRGPEELREFLQGPTPGYCVIREEELRELEGQCPLRSLEEYSVGHRKLVLVSGGPGNRNHPDGPPP